MNKEVQTLINFCRNKDEQKQKYYFSVVAGTFESDAESTITSHIDDKNATGATVLENTILGLEDMGFEWAKVSFYFTCKRELPETKKHFHQRRINLKTAPVKVVPEVGLMGFTNTNDLRGFIDSEIDKKSEQKANDYKKDFMIDNLTNKVADLEMQNRNLRIFLTKAKRNLNNTQEEFKKNQELAQKYKSQSGLGTIAMKGVTLAVMDKFGIDEKYLSGILPQFANLEEQGQEEQAPVQRQVSTPEPEFKEVAPQAEPTPNEQIISSISGWLKTVPMPELTKIQAVLQFASADIQNLDLLIDLIKQK